MNLKITLTILFGVSVAIANVTAAKLAWVPILIPLTWETAHVAVPAGFIAFGVAFLCSDLLVEFYGEDYAKQVINGTLVALVASWALIYAAIALPAAPFYGDTQAFNAVLGSGSAVVAASVITIAVSQHVDVRVFSSIRQRTGTGHKWARNIGSTATSQAIDTALFIVLAFAVFPALQGAEVLWGVPLLLTIVGQYTAKVLVALADTPVFYAVGVARRTNNEEVTA